jgi:hypothetical protein
MRKAMKKSGDAAVQTVIGSIKFDITPDHPVSLLGYFNDRISTGVADPLFCRVLVINSGSARLLIVQIDNCLIPTVDAEDLREKISAETAYGPAEVLICATHTHTAPALIGFYGARREETYRNELYQSILEKVKILQPDTPCTVRITRCRAEGLSHNRRWYMSDGKVMTNPPKDSKQRVKPEGAVDEDVVLIGFFNDRDDPLALLVSISNHTDSVGGTDISADWPGFLEQYVEEELGFPVNTVTLIAPQGNINHYDFDSLRNQTSHGEAQRIGRAYADLVLSSLPECLAMETEHLDAALTYVDIVPREISKTELQKAREILEAYQSWGESGDLKAEDLETPAVIRIFARELVAFHETRPSSYCVPLQVLRMGDIYLCGIPGEPFVEIGLELKRVGEKEIVIPVALANGYFGYIPLEACFERGGYEVKQGMHNCLSQKAAGIILEDMKKMIYRLRGKRAV